MNETIKTIMERRSIRAYKQDQIKDEELHIILEAGRFAPSAMNEQSWHFTVVQNKDLMKKINEFCRVQFSKSGNKFFEDRAKNENFNVFYNAPTFVIVSGEENVRLAQLDCALALENMFLAAASMEISSCWIHAVTQFPSTEEGRSLLKELGLPEGFKPMCGGVFGYKAMEASAAPRKENTINIIK